LLRLQAAELSDEDSLDKFTASINRVKTISALHELVYSSDNLQRINIEKYIRLIAQNLISSYNLDKDISLKITSDLENAQNDSFMPVGLGYVLLIIFVLALIALIFFMFINSERKGKKVGEAIELEEINPTEIPLSELEKLLKEAIDKGDYRGAVRIYFIFIIRDLSDKEWIQWEKEKTNFHYLREMAGKTEFDDFNRSVSYFEIIWYGKREIDAGKFEEIKPNFTTFLKKLGVN